MTDLRDFLQTIIDNPDDDLPRLVYAEWMQENARKTDRLLRSLSMSLAIPPNLIGSVSHRTRD